MLREVSLQTGVSKQTLSSSVAVLERGGTVALKPEGRRKRLSLTPAGLELAERADMEKYLELTERYLNDFQRETENL